MLLLIDNYDSFTYNLVQYFQKLGQDVAVFKNDALTLEDASAMKPEHLVISPGPNAPEDAGCTLDFIDYFHQKTAILGVCLGHQSLAYYFGAKIVEAKEICHGKTSSVIHHRQGLFEGISSPFTVTRYHSLAVEPRSLPGSMNIDAWAGEEIMAISHRSYPLYGLQFHPEAILTEHGLQLLANFLTLTRASASHQTNV